MGDHLAIARNPAVAFRQVCAIRSSYHGQKPMIGTAACWLSTDNANAGLRDANAGLRDSLDILSRVVYHEMNRLK